MDSGPNTQVGHGLDELVTPGMAHRVEIVHVASGRVLHGQDERKPSQSIPVAVGNASPRLDPLRQAGKLDSQDGRLQLVEPAAPPELEVTVTTAVTMVAQSARSSGHVITGWP